VILDKAEPEKGKGVSLINLQSVIKWILGADVTVEDSKTFLSAVSNSLPFLLESLEVIFAVFRAVVLFLLYWLQFHAHVIILIIVRIAGQTLLQVHQLHCQGLAAILAGLACWDQRH
jgi:hypothetical protein